MADWPIEGRTWYFPYGYTIVEEHTEEYTKYKLNAGVYDLDTGEYTEEEQYYTEDLGLLLALLSQRIYKMMK